MKADWSHLESWRTKLPTGKFATKPGDRYGMFVFNLGTRQVRCMADDGSDPVATAEEAGWEHVSVSIATHKGTAIPTWREMCTVKDLFWTESECVVQYHPPLSEYVNTHPHTLHLWRPTKAELPRPPKILV